MHLRKRLKRSAVVLAALVTLATVHAPAGAQVVKQIPQDALVVLKVANLQATSQKIANFCQQLGLQAFNPDLADPLAYLQRESNIQQGLDKTGEMAFAFIDPDAVGGNEDKAMVILVPVSDYAAFLTNFNDAKTEGDVTEVSLPKGNDTGFIAKWGDYAAISPSKELASRKPTGIAPSKLAAREMDAKDFVLFANVPELRRKFMPEMGKFREEAMNEIEKSVATNEKAQPYLPALRVAASQAVGILEAFLRDADAATISANVGTEGLSFTVLSDFRSDSYLGKMTATSKNTSASMLAGLPEIKYFAFGGATSSPEVSKQLMTDLLDPIVVELKKVETPEAKTAVDYVDNVRKSVDATEGMSFGMVQPSGALGQGAILQYIYELRGDAQALKSSYEDMMKNNEELSKLMYGESVQDVSTVHTPAAKTVEGIAFDQYQMKMTFDPASPEGAQINQMMTFMYGPEGMTFYGAPITNKNFLLVSGLSDENLAAVVASAKTGENLLGKIEGVKMVAAQLPEERSFEMYVPLDNVVTAAVGYAQQFGMPFKFQLPPGLPPIGISAGAEGAAIRGDVYVPIQLLSSLVSAGIQAFMQMQGQQPGGPGGL